MKKSLTWLMLTSLTATVWAEPHIASRAPWQRTMQPLKMKKVAPPRTVVAAPPVVTAPLSAPVAARPKLPVIKYLGSLQQGSERFLFAEVNGQVYSIRSGDDLAGLYHLVAVDEHEARFVYLPTHEDYRVATD